jgi:putative spermidine/putrescine transport system ATP-binding protein
MPAAIEFRDVTRSFGSVRAVDGVSVEVAAGEFFSMLGPSGSGKTTCLRLIAGFELPDSGKIVLDGVDVTDVPPYDRDVNTVFQDYALFPHMSVLENVEYGLKVRRVAAAVRRQRAVEMLELVKLRELGERRPGQLSGGQRQRVALARALINHPKVLLLDEPLGALDLKLREAMQIELKALQRELGITFVYVTHDQGEALSMSDRVAVFDHGRIVQVDTPRVLYGRPRSSFVAEFVGGANVLSAQLAARLLGIARPVAIRPEQMLILASGATPDAGWVSCAGTIADSQYHGATLRLQVRTGDGELLTVARSDVAGDDPVTRTGAAVDVTWSRASVVELEAERA